MTPTAVILIVVVGAVTLIAGLLIGYIYRKSVGEKIIGNAVDFYGALIISGIIGMFVFQIFENIAMTMGLMPVTGITLPFLSYGGSSIVSNMLAIALVLNIAVRSKKINF